MTFRVCLVLFFSGLSILSLGDRASAVHRCHVGAVPTPSTTILDLDHIATVTKSIAPLPTGFHYPDYLYLSDFQLFNCSSFSANTSEANACSSGQIALLSTGSGSMVFGGPESSGYSNYRYMNLSSIRVTSLEHTDVFVIFQFIPPYAHGGLSFAFSTYEFQIPKGSSKLLIPSLEEAGLTYVQTLQFTFQKGHNDSDATGPASVVIDDVEIVVPHTSPSSIKYTPTPVSTGCPTTAVTSCVACAPATPTATTQVLTFDDIKTGRSGSVPMLAHYKGFNFSPKATIVRSRGNNAYGPGRSSAPNALSGVPYQGDGFDNSWAISFSSEQTASFTIQEFYVTIFNISNPMVASTQSASLKLLLFCVNNGVNFVTIAIPAGEEMYKVNATATAPDSFADTYAVRVQAFFDDNSEAGVIIDDIKFERSHYPGLSDTCEQGLRTLTFDDIKTSCDQGLGNISAPETYHDFRLHYPQSAYEEPSPWNVTAASLFAANSSEDLVADGSRNILYGSTGTNGPFGVLAIFMFGRPTKSLLLDEQQSLTSNGDFDFDLISMRLGLGEIEVVSGAFVLDIVVQGFDKCGNQVAEMVRPYVPFPGTGGSVSEISAGMFAESNFVGLRKVQFSATAPSLPPGGGQVIYDVPFWIDSVEYRRSELEDSCPK
ncbi:hypothetical protein V1517DRAFT_316151 [Lipomyces orientalis]|uniref:Uncharacterized protein n=1 Tax=Lipomyces orientalis TaxID=1233043 RepID=A0ACC3TUT7_9ASCO